MKKIIIRVDASNEIGTGHIIRCRTLAREFKERGAKIIFICRAYRGNLIKLLQEEFTVIVLDVESETNAKQNKLDDSKYKNIYERWLKFSQEKDAWDTLEAIKNNKVASDATFIIVDHYSLDITWENIVIDELNKNKKVKLLVIDDLANRQHRCDYLLDQNYYGDRSIDRYNKLVPARCCQLLGPNFSLIADEYGKIRDMVTRSGKYRRILVYFGGADTFDLTSLTIEALMDTRFALMEVEVVIGIQSPNREKIERLVSKRPLTTLHEPMNSLIGLMVRTDIAIGAGGTSTWERACLGLPAIVTTVADNQVEFTESLEKEGFIKYIGKSEEVTVNKIQQAILLAQSGQMKFTDGRLLIDGLGTKRVVTALLGLKTPFSWQFIKQIKTTGCNKETRNEHIESIQEHQGTGNKSYRRNSDLQITITDACKCKVGVIKYVDHFKDESRPSITTMKVEVDKVFETEEEVRKISIYGLHAMAKYWETDQQLSKCKNLNSGRYVKLQSNILPSVRHTKESLEPSMVTIISDEDSWINTQLSSLVYKLWERGHGLRWIHHKEDIRIGDVCLILSCSQILNKEHLELNKHNLVVHESALPQGQGWSPMTWQIIEGKNIIPITLFEAREKLDTGEIYLSRKIELQGTELIDEWRQKQSQATTALCIDWFDEYKKVMERKKEQTGVRSYYKRRTPDDSKIDHNKTIKSQFDLLRVVDNEKYPAYFINENVRYNIKIIRDGD